MEQQGYIPESVFASLTTEQLMRLLELVDKIENQVKDSKKWRKKLDAKYKENVFCRNLLMHLKKKWKCWNISSNLIRTKNLHH